MRLSELKLKSQGKIFVKTPIRGIAKVGRNDKCICGSEIKYKKCCWKKYSGNFGEEK